MMSQDLFFATVLVVAGIAIIAIGFYYAIHQKNYYDATNHTVINEINIPMLGKVKSNVPAVLFCFLGIVPLWLGYSEMRNREANLVIFKGEISVDPRSVADVNAITIGVTSGSWVETATPDIGSATIPVILKVPDSWPTYTAYAFALGGAPTRPAIVGTSLDDPKFKLRIGP